MRASFSTWLLLPLSCLSAEYAMQSERQSSNFPACAMALQLANWAYTLLRPGGKLILGNFSSEEPGERLDAQIVDCLLIIMTACCSQVPVLPCKGITFDRHNGCIAGIRAFMDTIMEWKLIYRSPPELMQLIQACTFGKNGKCCCCSLQ